MKARIASSPIRFASAGIGISAGRVAVTSCEPARNPTPPIRCPFQ